MSNNSRVCLVVIVQESSVSEMRAILNGLSPGTMIDFESYTINERTEWRYEIQCLEEEIYELIGKIKHTLYEDPKIEILPAYDRSFAV